MLESVFQKDHFITYNKFLIFLCVVGMEPRICTRWPSALLLGYVPSPNHKFIYVMWMTCVHACVCTYVCSVFMYVCMCHRVCGEVRGQSQAESLVHCCIQQASWPVSFWGLSCLYLSPCHRRAAITDAYHHIQF